MWITPFLDPSGRNRKMDINTGINPQSFGFDRSFFEAGCKMGDEDRLRFYDSL